MNTATIEKADGTARPASKTKTLKDTFKAQTDKRVATEKAKASLSKPQQSYVSDAKPTAKTGFKPDAKPKAEKKATESQKIKILKEENPHAKGSKRAKHWDKALKSATTEDFQKAKGRMNLLPVWEKSGHIKLG